MKRLFFFGTLLLVLVAGAWLGWRTLEARKQARELEAARSANTLQAYAAYLAKYPAGSRSRDATALLEARLKDLRDARARSMALDGLVKEANDYFVRFSEERESAPSGAMFMLSMLKIEQARDAVAQTNIDLHKQLSELAGTLQPVLESNKKFLEDSRTGTLAQMEALTSAYVAGYPRERVAALLAGVKGPAEAEIQRLDGALKELEAYEKTQPATDVAPPATPQISPGN